MTDPVFSWLLPALLALVAFLYAAVGHGGASGYLAVMALLGVASGPEMKPSVLMLNLLVSGVAFWQYRVHFRWPLFWPFAVASVPAAFAGAFFPLAPGVYNKLLGVFLAIAIWRLLAAVPAGPATGPVARPVLWQALGIGLVVGLLSGMLGIGGGIVLSPVVLLLGWAGMKQSAALSASFIFVNSLAGFSGLLLKGYQPPPHIYLWLGAAFAGGLAGAYLGSRKLNGRALRYLLAGVLAIAAAKLLFS